MARPRKLNKETIESIGYVIGLGMPLKVSAFYVGIDPSTLIAWRNQGKEDKSNNKDSLESELYDCILKSQAQSMADRLLNIKNAEKEHWQCSAWILERRWPEFFGRDILIHDMREAGIDENKPVGELEDNELDSLIFKIKARIEQKKEEYIEQKRAKSRALENKTKSKSVKGVTTRQKSTID